MAKGNIPGLYEKGGIWHIDKFINGQRLCESTGTGSREEAEAYLIKLLNDRRQRRVFGVRPTHSFREAATRYILEATEAKQPSLGVTTTYLEQTDQFIGDLPITHVDNEALKPFIRWMKEGDKLPNGRPKRPSSNRTINIALQRVIRVLNCCHKEYRDDMGDRKVPWLDAVPAIATLNEDKNKRPEYPISWEEQRIFFAELPSYLRKMSIFKVNTGCREQEVCKLQWDWELYIPQISRSVFIIPAEFGGRHENSGVKNREDRVVVLNDAAARIVEEQRGQHPTWVFPFQGRAIHRMNGTAWESALDRAATEWKKRYHSPANKWFRTLRVHDLKHTFGNRLKAAGVEYEDRQVLLGHKSGSVTTHYSGSQVLALINHSNRILEEANQQRQESPTLTMLRLRAVA